MGASKVDQLKQEQEKQVINIEINKEKVEQKNILEQSHENVNTQKQKVEDPADDNGLGAVEEEKVKKAAKKAPVEPKHIGFDRKYIGISSDDSERMKNVKKALAKYYYVADAIKNEGNKKLDEVAAIDDVIKACKAYGKLRFSFLKGERGKERLKEVEELRLQAESKRRILKTRADVINQELIHNKAKEYYKESLFGGELSGIQEFGAGLAGLIRFAAGNLIRIASWPLLAPVWALNEGIRKIEEKTGHVPHRHLRFPGLHKVSYYAADTVRVCRGLKTMPDHGSTWADRFFTDYKDDKHILKHMHEDMEMAFDDEVYEEEEEQMEEVKKEEQEERASRGSNPGPELGKVEDFE